MTRANRPSHSSTSRVEFRRHQSSRGFTLLELLVAITLVGFLTFSLFASLKIAFKSRDAAKRAVEPGRMAATVMEFLRADIENALPPKGQLAGAFSGAAAQDERGHDGDDVTFFTTAAGPLHDVGANGEIKHVEWTVTTSASGNDHLLVRRVLNNLLAQQQEDPDEEVICRGVSGFSVRYFDGSDWLDTWDSTQQGDTLPLAMFVTVQLEQADPIAGNPPRVLTFTRVFQVPCYAPASTTDSSTGSTSGSSGSSGGAGTGGAGAGGASTPGTGGGR